MNRENIFRLLDKLNLQIKILEISDFIALNINKSEVIGLLSFLKESEDLRFTILTDLFAADFPQRSKRFEVVYNLLSLKLNQRFLVKVDLDEEESVPSATKLFSAACWYEREVYDMYGIHFDDTHDLRRILTDYGFVGHPLRKDFPVTGHLEVKYDEKLEKVIYQPVVLDLEFRMFDFLSPWRGSDYILPGDEKAKKPLEAK